MLADLMKLVSACWRPSAKDWYGNGNRRGGGDAAIVERQEGLLWYKDSGQHLNGEFSMAVVQANNLLEVWSQIESAALSLLESGHCGTFVGVYDGHGGPVTSWYINDHLFYHLMRNETDMQNVEIYGGTF